MRMLFAIVALVLSFATANAQVQVTVVQPGQQITLQPGQQLAQYNGQYVILTTAQPAQPVIIAQGPASGTQVVTVPGAPLVAPPQQIVVQQAAPPQVVVQQAPIQIPIGPSITYTTAPTTSCYDTNYEVSVPYWAKEYYTDCYGYSTYRWVKRWRTETRYRTECSYGH
jgi:hypothetical protein